jgi:thioredoxin-related protein
VKQFSSALAILSLILAPLLAHADSLNVSKVDDWSAEAAIAAKEGKPLMVVFSSESCNYCDILNSQVLNPMLENGTLTNRVLLREFKINRGGKVVDFSGDSIRSRIFVSRYHVYATPTVILLDQHGATLGDPIVGYNDVAAYQQLLNKSILRARTSPAFSAGMHVSKK